MLNKATSADDVPTPGYMFADIAKSTFADLNACQQLADYLIKKLERDNPQVKVKVLRIIRHVCDSGKPDFRRAVQKKADVVKACLQYRGAPDPLKGDAPNKAVRDEADAAVKSVFSSDAQTNAYGMSMEAKTKMTGFGSDASQDTFVQNRIGGNSNSSFGGGGGPPAGGGPPGTVSGGGFSSGKMQGFGNPSFDNAPKDDKATMFNQAMQGTLSAVSKITNKVSGGNMTMGGSMGSSQGSGGNMPENQSSYRAPAQPGMGGAGGGFGSGGQWGTGSVAAAQPSSAPSKGTTG